MLQEKIQIDKTQSGNRTLFLRDVSILVARRWSWYVVSLVFCLSIAWLIVQRTPNKYNVKALLQVNTPATSMDKELRTSDINNSAAQELYVLRSSLLMKSVVTRLNLCINYRTDGVFQDGDWYLSSPIVLEMVDKIYPNAILKIHLGDSSFTLNYNNKTINGIYGKVIATELGKMIIQKTKYFTTFQPRDMIVKLTDLDEATSTYVGQVSADVYDDKAGIISISVIDHNEQRAKDIANMLLTVYNDYCIEYNNRMAQNASDFIKERLSYISQDLANVDQTLANYKQSHNFINIGSQTGMALNSKEQYSVELTDINAQLEQVEAIYPMFEHREDYKLLPTNIINDVGIQTLINQYNQLVQTRLKFIEKSSSKGPVVQELNRQLDALKATIVQSVNNYKTSLKIKLQNTKQLMDKSSSVISTIPTGEKDLQSISRQQKIKEDLYLSLLSKREENAINLAMKESYTRVIEYAKGGKIFPQPEQIYSLALLGGLFFPSCLIFLINMLDVRIHSKKDITKVCNIPVVGVVPMCDKKEYKYVEAGKRTTINEVFNFLCSSIKYFNVTARQNNILLFSSSCSGDGKSYVIYNLAKSLANMGKKVLIINADMRKSEDYAGHKEHFKVGLSTWLSNSQIDLNDVISSVEGNPSIDIIHNGPIPPNPFELLSSSRLTELFSMVQSQYDYILVDSVPLGSFADSLAISSFASMFCFVINEKTSDRRMILDLVELVNEGKIKKISIIMNKYKLASASGYGYKYGSYGKYE